MIKIIMRLIRFVRRLSKHITLIWKDEDDTFQSVINMIILKLELLADRLNIDANNHHIVDEIREITIQLRNADRDYADVMVAASFIEDLEVSQNTPHAQALKDMGNRMVYWW